MPVNRPDDIRKWLTEPNNEGEDDGKNNSATKALPGTTLLLHPFNGHFSRTTWVCWCHKCKTSLDLSEARDDGGFGMAVASAGPYANNLHLTPDR